MKSPLRTLLCVNVLAFSGQAIPAMAQDHTGHTGPDEKLWSQAEAYFDPEDMAAARAHVTDHHGDQTFGMIMIDRAELKLEDDLPVAAIEAGFWYGGDINRLVVNLEAEYSLNGDHLEEADIELLWSRAISPYFNIETGLRHDIEPDSQTYAVLGLAGLAPYWFELNTTAYLSEEGDLTARFEAEYEFLLTQRLILQPRIELSAAAQSVQSSATASGLTDIEAGLRLRYELKREFAPYIGVTHHSSLGDTRHIRNGLGEDVDDTSVVIGIRAWF